MSYEARVTVFATAIVLQLICGLYLAAWTPRRDCRERVAAAVGFFLSVVVVLVVTSGGKQ